MNDNEQSKSKNQSTSRVFNVLRLALVGFDPTTFGL